VVFSIVHPLSVPSKSATNHLSLSPYFLIPVTALRPSALGLRPSRSTLCGNFESRIPKFTRRDQISTVTLLRDYEKSAEFLARPRRHCRCLASLCHDGTQRDGLSRMRCAFSADVRKYVGDLLVLLRELRDLLVREAAGGTRS
jgi:hypothetical protein